MGFDLYHYMNIIIQNTDAIALSIVSNILYGSLSWVTNPFKKYLKPRKSNKSKSKKQSFRDYTTDEIEGILWIWSWHGNMIENLTPLCPKCKKELELAYERPIENGRRLVSRDPIGYCCNKDNEIFEMDAKDSDGGFEGKIADEIIRRIRSGEFIKK